MRGRLTRIYYWISSMFVTSVSISGQVLVEGGYKTWLSTSATCEFTFSRSFCLSLKTQSSLWSTSLLLIYIQLTKSMLFLLQSSSSSSSLVLLSLDSRITSQLKQSTNVVYRPFIKPSKDVTSTRCRCKNFWRSSSFASRVEDFFRIALQRWFSER